MTRPSPKFGTATVGAVLVLALVMGVTLSACVQEGPFRMSLDGTWLFKPDSGGVGIAERWYESAHERGDWARVEVPGFWESSTGLAGYDGWGWYAKQVVLEEIPSSVRLHCAGVDDDAVVWVNGVEVGSHVGYSDPFALDLSGVMRKGKNTIVVLVKDNAGGGGIYRSVTLVDTKHLDAFLKSPYFGMPARASADWVRDAVIYSVYLRSFSEEGTFAAVQRRLPELKELGVTVLWLLPIHPIGEEKRKGSLGSPYSVKDFYAIDSAYGTTKDFRRLVEAVHAEGMHILLDLVANHTAWDSELMRRHPGWFTRNAEGVIIPPNEDWYDVADLDYANTALREYMIKMMRYWVADIGVDGFRCDVAELVPTEFWDAARRELDSVKPVLMLSEGTLPEHHMEAFDITYSWSVYDNLAPLLKGEKSVDVIDQVLENEQYRFPTGSLRLRFVTNHDKNFWDGPAVERYGKDGLAMVTVLVNTLPGVPLIYTGEEVANNQRLSHFTSIAVDWSRSREMGDLLAALNRLRRETGVLSRGEFVRIPVPDEHIYAFLRVLGRKVVLVVVNFSPEPRTATFAVPLENLALDKDRFRMRELFSHQSLAVPESSPTTVELDPRGYRIYVTE
ncbi:MAG: alpha-amylase family glycosyl hydrolase [Bacteroidota bacterium]